MTLCRDVAVPGGMILTYHRVARVAADPQLLAVTPEHFAEHLEVLRSLLRPMPLAAMAASPDRLPENAVALTFDDGYADNLCEAKPLLEHAGVPATFFIATGFTEEPREPFWNALHRIFLQPNSLPQTLVLEDLGYTADLGDAASYSPARFEADRHWNVLTDAVPTPRQRIYRDLCGMLQQAPTARREHLLAQLQAWAGIDPAPLPEHRMMNVEELRRLRAGGLLELGAHTVTHPLLSAETDDEQALEITQSKQQLEAFLDETATSFSYPFGGRHDFTPASIAAAWAAGFHCACANFRGWVTPQVDRFQLPRFVVRDGDGEAFARQLDTWRRNSRRGSALPPSACRAASR